MQEYENDLAKEEKPEELELSELDHVNFSRDPRYQFKQNGKLMQILGVMTTENDSKIAVSGVVDHTPNSKYNGEMLRKLRAERGVGKRK